MSTHKIDFYEDLTKIIFELQCTCIIKYAPYFFCWQPQTLLVLHTCLAVALFVKKFPIRNWQYITGTWSILAVCYGYRIKLYRNYIELIY